MSLKTTADPAGSSASYGGSEDDFPTYILKVLGKDRTWMDDGACRGHELARKQAWTVGSQDPPVTFGNQQVEPKELIAAALMVCAGCHRQYQCALWALEVREEAGTWAMDHDQLMWMWRQDNSEAIIHVAQIDKEPVQVAVTRAIKTQRREQRLARNRAKV